MSAILIYQSSSIRCFIYTPERHFVIARYPRHYKLFGPVMGQTNIMPESNQHAFSVTPETVS